MNKKINFNTLKLFVNKWFNFLFKDEKPCAIYILINGNVRYISKHNYRLNIAEDKVINLYHLFCNRLSDLSIHYNVIISDEEIVINYQYLGYCFRIRIGLIESKNIKDIDDLINVISEYDLKGISDIQDFPM